MVHEEYKGYIIAPGITMPAQGIYEQNVYVSLDALERGESVHEASSLEEAKAWIDGQEAAPSTEVLRIGLAPHIWDKKVLIVGKKPRWYEGGSPVIAYKFLAETYGSTPFSPNEAASLLVYEEYSRSKSDAMKDLDALVADDNIYVIPGV